MGITFRRLGLPDKLAFALDLRSMRFVPSLGARLAGETMDGQKARGYEPGKRKAAGWIGQVRKLTPLLVLVSSAASSAVKKLRMRWIYGAFELSRGRGCAS